jgi:hypothetical protein
MSSISDSQLAFQPFTKAYNDTAANIVGALNTATAVRELVPAVTAGWYNVAFNGGIQGVTNNTLSGLTFNLYSDAGGASLVAALNVPLFPANAIGTTYRFEYSASILVPSGALYTNFRSTGSAATIINQAYDFVTDTGMSFSFVRAQM